MPVARHEGVVMVSLWCCHGSLRVANSTPVEVAVVACTFGSLALAAERRLQPDARQNWLGASMFEVLPICAKIAQIHTHPADIDMNEASDEILTIDEVAAYLKAAVSVHRCAVARLSGVKQRSPGCAGRGSGRSVRDAARGQMTIGRALRRLSCGS